MNRTRIISTASRLAAFALLITIFPACSAEKREARDQVKLRAKMGTSERLLGKWIADNRSYAFSAGGHFRMGDPGSDHGKWSFSSDQKLKVTVDGEFSLGKSFVWTNLDFQDAEKDQPEMLSILWDRKPLFLKRAKE